MARSRALLDTETDRIAYKKAALEMLNAIDDYHANPTPLREQRMFAVANIHRVMINAKCRTCYDKGTVLSEKRGDVKTVPCPACSGK